MKNKEKTVCQIIRFRGKIEAFLVSIEEFSSFISHISSILLKYFIIILVLEIVTWAYNLKDKTAIKFM